MTNTSKLLYILPECAYAVELLPAKKPNTFTVQTFRQINGNFLDDNEFLAANVEKLVKKFENENFDLILPDFLFTNTTIDIQSTSDNEVQKQLKEKILPDLSLSAEEYYLKTFVLTQHQQKSKVQITALEKSLLLPLTNAAAAQKLHFGSVIPLSWTVKSAISLEPSLSTIQMGERLYVAMHYIGVDQTIDFAIADTKNIVETVKTLRGAEPNIQTMYLFTNELVENELKEHLSDTLPLQQLGNQVEAHEQMPAHVRYTVETAARTLSLSEYQVPAFSPDQTAKPALGSSPAPSTVGEEHKGQQAEIDKSPSDIEHDTTDNEEEMKKNLPIPAPTLPPKKVSSPDKDVDLAVEKKVEEETAKEEPKAAASTAEITSIEAPTVSAANNVAAPTVVVAPPAAEEPKKDLPPAVTTDSKPAAAMIDITDKVLTDPVKTIDKSEDDGDTVVSVAPSVTPSVMSPSSSSSSTVVSATTKESMSDTSSDSVSPISANMAKPPRPVLKKKNDAGDLLKVVFATVAALVITVAIGVGVGFGLLKLNQKKTVTQQPSPTPVVAEASPLASAAPAATSSATPATTSDKSTLKILVVNATKIAGKAGKFKSTLTTAGYKSVDTGNAKGTYAEAGMYVVLSKTAPADLDKQLGKDLSETLAISDQQAAEDPKGEYDAVIIINQ